MAKVLFIIFRDHALDLAALLRKTHLQEIDEGP
jgi:hypothetical protein